MNQTNEKTPRCDTANRAISALLIAGIVLVWMPFAQASTILNVYRDAYKEINAGASPAWRGMNDVEEWFRTDAAKIEKLLLEWMALGSDSPKWKHAMFLARRVPTQPIRDAIWGEMEQEFEGVLHQGIEPTEERHQAMSGPLAVLVAGGDPRARPVMNCLIQSPTCPPAVVGSYLKFLRSMGDADSLAAIEAVIARRRDLPLNRETSLARRFLQARVSGRDPLASASDELRVVTRRWVAALEAKDYDAYRAVLPFGGGSFDKHDFFDEVLPSAELPAILEAAKAGIDTGTFDIDRDKLEASMTVDGRYKFLYILEVDGWKTAGPIGVAP